MEKVRRDGDMKCERETDRQRGREGRERKARLEYLRMKEEIELRKLVTDGRERERERERERNREQSFKKIHQVEVQKKGFEMMNQLLDCPSA